jgi:hypothetical protein
MKVNCLFRLSNGRVFISVEDLFEKLQALRGSYFKERMTGTIYVTYTFNGSLYDHLSTAVALVYIK